MSIDVGASALRIVFDSPVGKGQAQYNETTREHSLIKEIAGHLLHEVYQRQIGVESQIN